MNVNMYKKMDIDMDVDTVMNITFFTKFENIHVLLELEICGISRG
jgi:hypothetical protein